MYVYIYIYWGIGANLDYTEISWDLGASPTRSKEGYIGIVEKEMETTIQTVWGSGLPKN